MCVYIYIYIYIYRIAPGSWPTTHTHTHTHTRFAQNQAYGQLLTIQALLVLPDPGALNSCMHAFPEENAMNVL